MKIILLFTLFLSSTFGMYTRDVETPIPMETEDTISNDDDLSYIDEKWSDYQKYIDFVKANHRDINAKVFYATKEDIDLDQNEEVIIAFGTADPEPLWTDISHVFLLRERNEKIEQLGDNLAAGGYGTYEVKLIHLQNRSEKYVYLGITNGRLKGFMIYELSNHEPKLITYSASPTGSGEDQLIDKNGDGQFDGYEQNRSSYDVLYYPLRRVFEWKDNEFLLEHTDVELPEYPMSVKEVITQYITLRVLDIEKSSEADKRLAELCTYDEAEQIDISVDIWYSAIYHSILLIDHQMEFVVKETNDETEAIVSFVDEDNKTHELTFYLVKSDDDRWVIHRILSKGNLQMKINVNE